MKLVILVLAAAACAGGARSTTTTTKPAAKPPGLLWMTEARPGRLGHAMRVAAADGDVAAAAGDGYLARLDLATGALRETPVGADIYDLAALGRGRFVAVGLVGFGDARKSVAFGFDATTGAVTPIALQTRPDVRFALPHVVVLAQGVVISGRGLPLAVYDPATWERKTQLDGELGWDGLAGAGHVLVATRGARVMRFDLETEGQKSLMTAAAFPVGIHGDRAVMRVLDGGKWKVQLVDDAGGRQTLPDEVSTAVVVGDRVVTAVGHELRIYTLPSGDLEKKISLGAAKVSRLNAAGKRVVFDTEGVLRILDVATGTLSPMGDEPWRATWVAVDDAGHVATFGRKVWRFDQGALVGTDPMPDSSDYGLRADDPTRLAVYVDGLEVRKLGGRGAPARTPLDGTLYDAWLAADDRVIVERVADGVGDLVMVRGDEIERLIRFDEDASALYADPDGAALIGLRGRVAVVDVKGRHATGTELRMPGCSDSGRAITEAGGHRAALYDENVVALWDHVTGDLRAAVKLDGEVTEVKFVPGKVELVITTRQSIVLWAPRLPPRTIKLGEASDVAVSRDGKRLAVAFADARVAVFDLDTLRAGLPEGPPLPAAELPDRCPGTDPMATPSDQGHDDDGDDDGE